ncbi:hypothetical protein PYCC9005_005342 [Savitreella phatthalungensis]
MYSSPPSTTHHRDFFNYLSSVMPKTGTLLVGATVGSRLDRADSLSSLQGLPAEVRQQILSYLPNAQLRQLQFLCWSMYCDIDTLFSSQPYVESSLTHLEETLLEDHRSAVRSFRANSFSAGCTPGSPKQQQEVRNMSVLFHLLKWIGGLREHGFHAERDLVKQITLRCRSALRTCAQNDQASQLWSDDIQQLMYPSAARMPYKFVSEI